MKHPFGHLLGQQNKYLDPRELNPMLIDHIFQNVLQHIPINQLKNIRLVCRLWRVESLVVWRRTQWLTLSMFDIHAGRHETESPDHKKDAANLKKCLFIGAYVSASNHPTDPYQFKNYPFQKFRIFKSILTYSSTNEMKNNMLEAFCRQVGPFVTALEVKKCTFVTFEDFWLIVFQISPNLNYLSLSGNLYKARNIEENVLPHLNCEIRHQTVQDVQTNLTHLSLSMEDCNTTEDDYLPISWARFFAHFPNIQSLKLVKIPYKTETADEVISSLYALHMERGILQSITQLDILNVQSHAFREIGRGVGIMANICSMRLPLTFFAYDIGHQNTDVHNLREQLRIGSQTLETLVIYKHPVSAPFGEFPFGNNFPNLTTLMLVGPIVRNLHFLEHMPNLKNLRLFHSIDDIPSGANCVIPTPEILEQLYQIKAAAPFLPFKFEVVESEAVVANTNFEGLSSLTFPNMEELVIDIPNKFCSANNIEQLCRLMPNIKRLRIALDLTGVCAVRKNWKHLEQLDVILATEVITLKPSLYKVVLFVVFCSLTMVLVMLIWSFFHPNVVE